MYYVYLLKSLNFPDKVYIGYTANPSKRIEEHNSGDVIYTSKYRPWEFIVQIGFKNKNKAIEFEKYLKSGSGNAFASKRLR